MAKSALVNQIVSGEIDVEQLDPDTRELLEGVLSLQLKISVQRRAEKEAMELTVDSIQKLNNAQRRFYKGMFDGFFHPDKGDLFALRDPMTYLQIFGATASNLLLDTHPMLFVGDYFDMDLALCIPAQHTVFYDPNNADRAPTVKETLKDYGAKRVRGPVLVEPGEMKRVKYKVGGSRHFVDMYVSEEERERFDDAKLGLEAQLLSALVLRKARHGPNIRETFSDCGLEILDRVCRGGYLLEAGDSLEQLGQEDIESKGFVRVVQGNTKHPLAKYHAFVRSMSGTLDDTILYQKVR